MGGGGAGTENDGFEEREFNPQKHAGIFIKWESVCSRGVEDGDVMDVSHFSVEKSNN